VYGSTDMVSHMKTTVEINDALMLEARRLAEARGETMRSFLEEALRRLIADYDSEEPGPPSFELTVVDGDGLVEGVTPASWLEIANVRASFTVPLRR
jgi:Bacterial antitoxin of type II TA system, VapB